MKKTLKNNPAFNDFVKLAHRRFGYRKQTVKRAASNPSFVKWFKFYLREGCGVKG